MARLVGEIATAMVWLTRLPLGRFLPAQQVPLAQVAWAFPLAGALVAAMASVVLLLAVALGLSAPVAAILTLASLVALTGALHEDGLADYVDGCGGMTRERSLEIMRDSRIGTYGALALVLVLALRLAILAELIRISPSFAAIALIWAAMLSRAGATAAMALVPAARADGQGQAAGRVSGQGMATAIALATIVALGMVAAGIMPLWAAIAGFGAGFGAQAMLARQSMRRLGGQTGDVLGAIQQVGEASALLVLQIAAGSLAA